MVCFFIFLKYWLSTKQSRIIYDQPIITIINEIYVKMGTKGCNMMILNVFVVAIFAPLSSFAGTMGDKKLLYNNLTADYNKDIIPIYNQSASITVDVSLSVVALNDIDEISEKFAVSGFFTISWYDENMIWNGWEYGGIYQLHVGYNKVWVPELILLNPTEKVKSLGEDWHKIRYYYTGLAQWFPAELIEATCSIDVYNFPFDVQECYLNLQVYGYGVNEVKLNTSRKDINLSDMAPHSSWIISETKAYVVESFSSSQAIFKFRFERRPQFVIVNVILPILFMCFLNVMVFLLPVDSGERIGYAITVLLAIAVYMTIVSDNLPKTSEPLPLISYLMIICLIVSVSITVVIVLNLRLFHKDSTEPVPTWLIRVYHVLTCKTCLRRNSDKTVEDRKSIPEKEKGQLPANKVGILPEENRDDERLTEQYSITWKDISNLVDYISLLVSVSVLILSFMVILLMANNSEK